MELRHRGYLRALAEAGLHADPRLYGEVAYAGYRQHVCDTLDRILATVPDTDGFFFTTHILATEALRYFHDRGIDIDDGRRGLLPDNLPPDSVTASRSSAPTPCLPAGNQGKATARLRPPGTGGAALLHGVPGTNKPVPSGHPPHERPAKREVPCPET